ncbi:MAG: Crp/Fnr family transcriptional regulator [Bacteroidota bacterium]
MNANTKTAFLEQFPLFSVLSAEEKQRLIQMVEFKRKARHQYIYMTGDTSDTIYFLAKGVVKIGTHSNDGREVIKAILHPMAMFGELCVVGESNRPDFARAMSQDVQYFALNVQDFKSLISTNHRLCNRLMNMLGERLRKTENRLEALIFKDARTRIIEFIKDSARKRGMRIGLDETLVKHTLTQQDIANITGTSRQTVTSVLNDLKKSNLIHFNRRSILIRDLARLA